MKNKYQAALNEIKTYINIYDQQMKQEEIDTLQELINKHNKLHPKLIPCKCGYNKRTRTYGLNWMQYTCMKCGISVMGKNEKDTIERWNEVME